MTADGGSGAAAPGGRLKHLDGLRGVAAVAVVFLHCVAQFHYPWSFGPVGVLTGWSRVLAATPLNVLYAGNLAVCVFFVHSGIVLALPHLRSDRVSLRSVLDMAARRPIRLVVPIAGALLVSLTLTKLGLFEVNVTVRSALRTMSPQTEEMLNRGAPWGRWLWDITGFGVMFGSDSRFLPVLWTMPVEFAGSYVVLALVGVFPRRGVRIAAGAAALVAALWLDQLYMTGFIAGVLLAEAVVWHERRVARDTRLVEGTVPVALRRWLVFVALAAGLWFGTLPEFRADAWAPLWRGDVSLRTRLIGAHLVGATLIVIAVLGSAVAKRLLSHRSIRELGRISFSLYLLHEMVLFALGNRVFLRLRATSVPYAVASTATALVVLVVSLVAAWWFTRWIDEPAIRLAKRVSAAFGLRPRPSASLDASASRPRVEPTPHRHVSGSTPTGS